MYANLIKDLRAHGQQWTLTGLVTVFGMQIMRVLFVGFVGYLRDSQGMGSLTLAPIAIGVFALSFLAGPLNRFAGTRNAQWITAGGLAVVRVAEQISQSAPVDLFLSAAGTALLLMYFPIAIGIARAQGGDSGGQFGMAFLLGLSLDSAIQICARTLDLSWQPGLIPIVIIVFLAAILLWSLANKSSQTQTTNDASWLNSVSLLALGPFLFLQLLVFQNVAAFSSLTGLETPAAGAILIAGNAVALAMAARVISLQRQWTYAVLAGLMLAILLYMTFSSPPLLAVIWLILGQIFAFTLGVLIFAGACSGKGNSGLLRLMLMNSLDSILFVLLLFIYYASYDINFGYRNGVLRIASVAIITIVVALGHLPAVPSRKAAQPSYSIAMLAATLLIIPLAMLPGWKALAAKPAPAGTDSVRIMQYNLHDAANADGRIDPEGLARVIEDSGADIVGLQEVSRGWLVWGGMDMLTWLSQRLGMPYVWGPTADAQWGNAILSRYPITKVSFYDLPPRDLLILRGFIWADIDIDGFPLTMITTHFAERAELGQERVNQSLAILNTWNNHAATVITGDFNALPGSEAITVMLDAGLIDISREIGQQPTYTYSSVNPDHQIDYIFVTPDLGYGDFEVPQTTASDHLPLVATIELPK